MSDEQANCLKAEGGESTVLPLTDTPTEAANTQNAAGGDAAATKEQKPRVPREPRQPRQRGPPEDGISSKNKIMVANLPYDLSEEKVRVPNLISRKPKADTVQSSRSSL